MGSPVHISDKNVVEVVPYATKATFLRLDVGPFALLYAAVCCGYYLPLWAALGGDEARGEGSINNTSSSERNMVAVLMVLPAVLVLHLLVFLSTQWSVQFCCAVSQRRVTTIDLAEVWYADRGRGGKGTTIYRLDVVVSYKSIHPEDFPCLYTDRRLKQRLHVCSPLASYL